MPATIPREGLEKLLIDDGRLESGDHRRVSERRPGVRHYHVSGDESGRNAVTWDRERRKRRVGYSRQADLRRKILAQTRPGIDEFAPQVGVAEIARNGGSENKRVWRQQTLHT